MANGKTLRLKKPVVQQPPTSIPDKKTVKKKVKEVEPPYFIPGLPLEEGPKNHSPAGVLGDKSGEFVITVDRGTFQYVWEMLEARAHGDHKKFSTPNIQRVTEEAVRAFRNAADHNLPGRAKAKSKPKLKIKGK